MQGVIERPYTDPEKVEECMALLAVGHSSLQIEKRTGVPSRTVRGFRNSPALAAKYGAATKAARERIAYRWGQVVEDSLDKLEDGTEKITAVKAMVGWGIATDKVQKESSPSKGQAFVIVRSSDGTTIEVGTQSG